MNNILKVSVKDIPEVVEAMEKASKEIERLQNQNKSLNEMYELLKKEYIKSQNKVEDLQADYGNKAQVERDLLKEENKRLNNIIKEVREEIKKLANLYDDNYTITDKAKDILEILDKGE